ncbi:hypothetical protein AB0P21_40850 [Kribbella sp. NPDC056861]|uniref:hypothetical protein n=1 Tax=Kribbella sp. NPDC056861 TaxID=3154857 RepID=UPI0034276D1D
MVLAGAVGSTLGAGATPGPAAGQRSAAGCDGHNAEVVATKVGPGGPQTLRQCFGSGERHLEGWYTKYVNSGDHRVRVYRYTGDTGVVIAPHTHAVVEYRIRAVRVL